MASLLFSLGKQLLLDVGLKLSNCLEWTDTGGKCIIKLGGL